MIPNTKLGPTAKCGTHTASVDPSTGKGVLTKHSTDPSYRSLVNLYASRGLQCDAIKVEVSVCLKDKQSLVSAMRSIIRAKYSNPETQNIGLGGVFRVVAGAIKSHIMPGYPSGDLDTTDQVNSWLKFYQPIEAPMTCFRFGLSISLLFLNYKRPHFANLVFR